MAGPNSIEVPFYAATDTGLIRSNNEDRYRADGKIGLFLVVDGVGGQAAGEVASECVATTIYDFVAATDDEDNNKTWPFELDLTLSHTANRLRVGTLLANRRLSDQIAADDELTGMAATMTAVLLRKSRAAVGNVGDCRTYLFRTGALKQMTRDHSWVAEQVQMGLLTAEAASRHPMRNVVTRALDGENHLVVDIVEFDIQSGDTLLLCSDGLSSMVNDQEIAACLRSAPDAEDACLHLMQAAKQAGGKDNITVVVVRVPESRAV